MATRFKLSADIKVKGNFIQGEFSSPKEVNGEWVCRSPADFSDEFGKVQYSYSSVDEAVQSSRNAFLSWRRLTVADRAAYLKKYQAALLRHEDFLTEVIAREVGKPLWEAKTELAAMVGKVDITIQDSMTFIADFEIPTVDQVKGKCRYRPLGVMAVVGPFNFPGHLPNGHIMPALLTGNTVIFKPSEKTPLVGQVMAECFQEAGFPPGVFNVIQGEREVGRRLVTHEGIDGVLFTGSYEVGTRIKQDTLQQHWKLLALEMGGKNSAIVCSDADMDIALHESLLGAFLTSGQRCSATSRILVDRSVLPEFVDRFHQRSKAFKIGHPMDSPFMGPLIDQGSVDRFMKFLGIATREGCEIIMRGKSLELETSGNYVTPSICLANQISLEQSKKSVYQQTELFAPNVVILGVDSLDEAIAQANVTQFGLAASVFTKSRQTYEKCWDSLEAGVINWNKSTVGASSRLPFGGLKKSGNHFPTAVLATKYCTFPVASLECQETASIESLTAKTPGLNWK
ncbi:MAG: succinylglutamate-semialdehyde dehydrogenase [Bdellovibrionia bacterium]